MPYSYADLAGPNEYGNPWDERIHDLKQQVVNVKDFGAKGDGFNDDTAAINAACDYAPVGSTIFFPSGTYLTTNIIRARSFTTICGAGMGITTIKRAPGSYASLGAKGSLIINDNYAATDGVNNVMLDQAIHIRDLTLDGNRPNMTSNATETEGIDFVQVYDFSIVRVEILNAVHDAMDIDGSKRGLITGCKVVGVGTGAWNAITANGSPSTYTCEDIRIIGNYVEACGQGRIAQDDFYAGIHNDSVRGIVAFNQIVNCHRAVRVGNSQAQVVVVGNVARDCQADYDFKIESSQSIVANNSSQPAAAATGCFYIGGSGWGVCEGNTMTDGGSGIIVESTGPWAIKNNIIRGAMATYALKLQGAAHIAEGNQIENKPSSNTRGAITAISTAIGARIIGNRIGGTAAGRAILSQADDVIVANNFITGANATYIEIEADDNIVTGNRGDAATTEMILVDITADFTRVSDNNGRGSAVTVTNNGLNTSLGTNL